MLPSARKWLDIMNLAGMMGWQKDLLARSLERNGVPEGILSGLGDHGHRSEDMVDALRAALESVNATDQIVMPENIQVQPLSGDGATPTRPPLRSVRESIERGEPNMFTREEVERAMRGRRILVFAGTHQEFMDYCRQHQLGYADEVVYASETTVWGTRLEQWDVRLAGTWFQHQWIHDVLQQVVEAQRRHPRETFFGMDIHTSDRMPQDVVMILGRGDSVPGRLFLDDVEVGVVTNLSVSHSAMDTPRAEFDAVMRNPPIRQNVDDEFARMIFRRPYVTRVENNILEDQNDGN